MHHDLVQRTRLFVFDYDGTLAETGQESPNKLTVEKAYALALDEIFGTSGLLNAIGGLVNRAPAELALDVLRLDPSFAGRAYESYACLRDRLSGLVPDGKGVDLERARERADDLGFCAELIVRVKLAHLNREQDHEQAMWPVPCAGVPAFLGALADRAWGVISSGHETFIAGSFRRWGIPYTDLSVTDDDLRHLSLPVKAKVKPSPFLVDVLLERAASRGLSFERDRMLIIGDDPVKDGGLAANAGVRFLCFNPQGKALPKGVEEFRHYDELTRHIG